MVDKKWKTKICYVIENSCDHCYNNRWIRERFSSLGGKGAATRKLPTPEFKFLLGFRQRRSQGGGLPWPCLLEVQKFFFCFGNIVCVLKCRGGSRGGHGAMTPKAPKVPVVWPPNGKFLTIKNITNYFLFLLWRIFKIKWPKSEEKIEFGGRGWLGARPVAPQTDRLDPPMLKWTPFEKY